ncbi:MAG: hypothetical protein PHO41_09015 [Eubacteriales bacterium]|nr:hypothetical protein [Eubacteriales bacterium]
MNTMNVDRANRSIPNSRVYAPTRGTAAYAYALPAYEPEVQPVPEPRQEPERRAKPAASPQRKQHLSIGGKIMIVFSLGLMTVTLLLVIARYADISAQHLEINQIKENIKTTELRLAELNVALQCTVSIKDAQAAAARLGMTYPESSQYVRVGDPLPRVAQQTPGGAAPME